LRKNTKGASKLKGFEISRHGPMGRKKEKNTPSQMKNSGLRARGPPECGGVLEPANQVGENWGPQKKGRTSPNQGTANEQLMSTIQEKRQKILGGLDPTLNPAEIGKVFHGRGDCPGETKMK